MEAAVRAKDANALAALVTQHLGGRSDLATQLLQAAVQVLATADSLPKTESSVPKLDVANGTPQQGADDAEFLTLNNLSLVVPRGRFDLSLMVSGLKLIGKGVVLGPVHWADVSNVIKLPKSTYHPRSGMPPKAFYIVMVLRKPLAVGKQQHSCIVINADGLKPLSKINAQGLARGRGAKIAAVASGCTDSEAEGSTLPNLLSAAVGVGIDQHDPKMCELEWVRAHRGVDEGALYALPVGFVFLPRPAMFIPAKELAGITAGRGGGIHVGASSTDLVIERLGAAQPEVFSNINRDDVAALASYVAAVTRIRGRGAESASGSQGRSAESDDEEADEDYEHIESGEEEEGQAEGQLSMACSSRSAAQKHSSKRQVGASVKKEPVSKRTRSSLRGMRTPDVPPDLPSDHESYHESEGEEEEQENET